VLPGDAFSSSLLHAVSGNNATAPMTAATFRYPLFDTQVSSFAVYRLAD
jgi:hypothetical protein